MQKKPKTVLTRLLLALVDENARYDTALRQLSEMCHDCTAKNIMLGVNQVEMIIRSAGFYDSEKIDVPQAIKEYSADEDENGERSAHCCRC